MRKQETLLQMHFKQQITKETLSKAHLLSVLLEKCMGTATELGGFHTYVQKTSTCSEPVDKEKT